MKVNPAMIASAVAGAKTLLESRGLSAQDVKRLEGLLAGKEKLASVTADVGFFQRMREATEGVPLVGDMVAALVARVDKQGTAHAVQRNAEAIGETRSADNPDVASAVKQTQQLTDLDGKGALGRITDLEQMRIDLRARDTRYVRLRNALGRQTLADLLFFLNLDDDDQRELFDADDKNLLTGGNHHGII